MSSRRVFWASTWRILFRHLLPNVSNLLIVALTISLGRWRRQRWLSFRDRDTNRPTFGLMISEAVGLSNVREHTHLILVPAFFISALVLAFNLLGDQLTDVLSPRRR